MKRLLWLGFLFAAAPAAATVNPNCTTDRCALTPGRHVYATDEGYVSLYNASGRRLRIDSVQGISSNTSGPTGNTEYAVYYYRSERDIPPGTWRAPAGQTRDLSGAPKGDVAATWVGRSKTLPTLNWGGLGLTAIAGSWTFLHANAEPGPWGQTGSPSTPEMLWIVNVSEGEGIEVERFPLQDEGWFCSGQTQWTTWRSLPNDTSQPWTVTGATIFASDTGNQRDRVDGACMYVRTPADAGAVDILCERLREQGEIRLSRPLVVQPGQRLAVQSINSCPAGHGVWDWGAFVWIKR